MFFSVWTVWKAATSSCSPKALHLQYFNDKSSNSIAMLFLCRPPFPSSSFSFLLSLLLSVSLFLTNFLTSFFSYFSTGNSIIVSFLLCPFPSHLPHLFPSKPFTFVLSSFLPSIPSILTFFPPLIQSVFISFFSCFLPTPSPSFPLSITPHFPPSSCPAHLTLFLPPEGTRRQGRKGWRKDVSRYRKKYTMMEEIKMKEFPTTFCSCFLPSSHTCFLPNLFHLPFLPFLRCFLSFLL